jgi:hypothetical protein
MTDITAYQPLGGNREGWVHFSDDPLPALVPIVCLSHNGEDLNVNGPLHAESGAESSLRDYITWFGNQRQMGIIPAFLLSIWGTIIPTLGVILNILCWAFILILLCRLSWYEETWASVTAFWLRRLLLILASSINWSPVAIAYRFRRKIFSADTATSVALLLSALIVFGLISWGYCALVSDTTSSWTYIFGVGDSQNSEKNVTFEDYLSSGILLQGWSTGNVPRGAQYCAARVAPEQSPLFTNLSIYTTQFARTFSYITNASTVVQDAIIDTRRADTPFDANAFESVRTNHTLCSQGFQGNSDLYGLGIRCGVYLQWASCLLANNFLSSTRQELQKVYMICSLAICLATVIISAAGSCVFAIEVEILYWMYWGGFVCVYASAPCIIRLGSLKKMG